MVKHSRKSAKSARLILIERGNALSKQLKLYTGSSKLQDFDENSHNDVLTHRQTGKVFLVLTKQEYNKLTYSERKEWLDDHRKTLKVTRIYKPTA